MKILIYVILGFILLLLFIYLITLLLQKSIEKKLNNFNPIYLGKLDDNTDDDILGAMQFIKLTNSIKK